jgi:hypothetical protein
MPRATRYELNITLPNGQSIVFETSTTTRDQYLESLRMGGTYDWEVRAIDEEGRVLCKAGPRAFEKADRGHGGEGGEGSGGGGETVGGFGDTYDMSHITIGMRRDIRRAIALQAPA